MKEIIVNNNTYLFIECDQDSHNHSLTKFKTHAVINYKRNLTGNNEWSDNIGGINVKLLDYTIISTTKDITEEQAESIIDSYGNPIKRYIDYMNNVSKLKSCDYSTAKGSLQSLIQANGLDINKNYLILKKL